MANTFNDTNFQTEVLQSDKLTMVDFWAPWCGPCIALGKTIDILATDYADKINVGKLNTDENPQVSLEYGVMNLPCVLFFKNGQVVDKHIGLAARNVFEKKIQQHM
ncbi:thioredoxin [Polluticoccus soli]|uniref:thioredoxin n=1 Tax=Polluticoccus soli TaxID=3034150 RepID=UPI0023E33358|nr:thioredoxin [Flavipsychrobacter sp. JY13-12]